MPVQKLTNNSATSLTPQVVTLIVDDSGSMTGATAAGPKNEQATAAMRQLVMTMQSWNQGATGSRYILNIAKFGTGITPIAEAAKPESISLNSLVFGGDSGGTEMPGALAWAAQALKKALSECKKIAGYTEEASPSPLVLFFSDGENTGGDVQPLAKALKSIPFSGGGVDVVAVGIGLDQKDFAVMEGIASRPNLCVNIDPGEVAEFIADVGATLQRGESPEALIKKYDL
jgi:hypothetical protein